MIIELEIQLSKELLIETRTTGLQGYVCYWNGDRRVSVTGELSAWRRKGRDVNRDRGAYNCLRGGNENSTHTITNQRSI